MKHVFILGAQRSGTTWALALLRQHPQVAGIATETHLFNAYVQSLEARWDEHRRGGAPVGLPTYLSEEQFYALLRDFAARALDLIAQGRRDVALIAEKTPQNALAWRLILRLFPDAYFLHVVRDPRDTVCSLRAA